MSNQKLIVLMLASTICISLAENPGEGMDFKPVERNIFIENIHDKRIRDYVSEFWKFLASEDFADLIKEQEELAAEKDFNKTFYIAGYVMGFREATHPHDLGKLDIAQGEDRPFTKIEIYNHEMAGYYAGREAGLTFGLELWDRLSVDAEQKITEYILDYNKFHRGNKEGDKE